MSAPQEMLVSNESATYALRTLKQSCIAFIVLDTLFVFFRFFSRFYIKRLPFWWDDAWIIPAYLANIAVCTIGLIMYYHETAGNPPDALIIDPAKLEPLLKCIYAVIQFLLPGYIFTRFSVIALYLRIFSGRKVRVACWTLAAFMMAMWIAYGFTSLFQCKPVSYFWNRAMMPPGKCVDINEFYRSFTPPNIAWDVAIVVIPIPSIWQLKASRSRKLGLTFLFSVAIIALIASCLRWVAYLRTSSTELAPSYTNSLVSWIIIEPGIYLIAACLPAMHHLFVAMTPRFLRDATERGLARARYRTGGAPSIPTPAKLHNSHMGQSDIENFQRLVDSDSEAAARGVAESNSNTDLKAAIGKPSEAMDVGDGKSSAIRNDMSRVETGDAIMMRTDIVVTTEEKIHEVIGF